MRGKLVYGENWIVLYVRKDKLAEISGRKCVAADVSTAAAAIIKANDARGVAVTSAWQPALFLLDNLADNQ